ncbi:MAG TPA: response regulator transcription factor [Chloroflexia bacterium]|nr:response regulator transcription factor [Chloroflexia bacterium]
MLKESLLENEPVPSESVSRTRIVIIDDNFVMRAGLRSAIELDPELVVVGEGENGYDAVRLSEELKPDLMLMDFRMPKLDGINATRQITASRPDARILMTTWNEEPQTLVEAILAGAKGYLVHGRFNLNELSNAIRAVRDGGALITPSLAPVLLELVRNSNNQERQEAGSPLKGGNSSEGSAGENGKDESPVDDLLTRRERSILELVQQGKSNRDIAEALTIEEKTVKNHINSIYSKLHLRNRYEAITFRRGSKS